MSSSDFLRRYRKALGLGWAQPPATAGRKARERPDDEPFPPAPESAGEGAAPPDDVRAARAEDTGVHHVSAHGLDATVMVQPPEGDDLWTLRGRIWLEGAAETPVRAALIQGDHVLAQSVLRHGGRFTFRDVLAGPWTVELRWGNHAAVLRGDAS